MEWLSLPAAFGISLLASFLALALGGVSERRRGRDAAVDRILAALPGHDCGLCGLGSCRRFARAVAAGHVDHRLCSPAGQDPANPLGLILGQERARPRMAFVGCAGGTRALPLFSYAGARTCQAATRFHAGGKLCAEACLGFGDCARACPLGAIAVKDGAAAVDAVRCVGCGLCLPSCPKGLISLVPAAARWQVACSSRKKPGRRAEDCAVACTACGDCVALSAEWQFTLEGGLARASGKPPQAGQSEAAWEMILKRCPTGAIRRAAGKKSEDPAS